jgi:hypothetical protein
MSEELICVESRTTHACKCLVSLIILLCDFLGLVALKRFFL